MEVTNKLFEFLRVLFEKQIFLFASLVVGVLVFFSVVWNGGHSIGGVMAGGALQVSDAQGYWMCANSIIDFGTIDEWCMRRPIYDVLLSGIVKVADHNIYYTLITQSILLISVIFLFSQAVLSMVGRLGSWLVAFLLFTYASFHAFPVTMSENAGLIFGCLAFSFLLMGIEQKKTRMIALGFGIISVGLAARPGALFLIPALILFSVCCSYILYGRVKSWVVLSLFSMLLGFILQLALVKYFGGNPQSSSSNFAYTIYGLSVGGKGWNQAFLDFPNFVGREYEVAQFLYRKSFENVMTDPSKIINGISLNAKYAFDNGTLGYGNFGWLKNTIKNLWLIGWIPILLRLKQPSYLLLGLSSLSIYLSALFIYMDGGSRLFAATVAVDALQVVVGIVWIVKSSAALLSRFDNELERPKVNKKSTAHFMDFDYYNLIVLSIVLISFLGLFGTWDRASKSEAKFKRYCSARDYQIITYVGASRSLLLELSDDEVESMRGKISRDDFLKKIDHGTWWRDELMAFQGKSLLLAYQYDSLSKFSPNYENGVPMVYSENSIFEYYGQKVAVCVDPIKYLKIFGAPYFRINSIHRLDGSD